ncbi:nudC domain-containing protein 2-like isoform X2 [Mya arenaria]|uniref:nudC domain-containing protein 2-like isoform X2 n=1 Tax=Mya arenaria TaxID=6604 RepID=UPI0022DF8E37|nr:nudC domain-containing protein 2-like isoform X2 [Mya arenaria]
MTSEMSHFDETSGVIVCGTEWGRWWQTLEEVHVEVDLPEGTKASMLRCTITNKTLNVLVRGEVKIKGNFPCLVKADDSVWTIDRKLLHICLLKVKTTADQCWKSLLTDQYQADPYTQDQMQRKLTLQRYQFENPGMDFSNAEISGNYHTGGPELPGS